MLNVRRDGELVKSVATLSEASEAAKAAGAPEDFHSRIVEMGRRSLGRVVWEDDDGWLVERVAPRYFTDGRPGGERECEECGKPSDGMYICGPYGDCAKRRVEGG